MEKTQTADARQFRPLSEFTREARFPNNAGCDTRHLVGIIVPFPGNHFQQANGARGEETAPQFAETLWRQAHMLHETANPASLVRAQSKRFEPLCAMQTEKSLRSFIFIG